MKSPGERRRVQRVRLIQPLRGTVGPAKIYVLDVSLLGLRIAHQEPIGEPGQECRVIFEWQEKPIELRCRLTRTETTRPSSGPSRTLYQSGMEIVFAQPLSREHLAGLIHDYFCRAVDEQRSRTVSTDTQADFQSATSTTYVRHDLVRGQWQTMITTETTQPMSGFTISSDETRENVAMLRDAFEAADPSLRHVIRKMAELSINNSDKSAPAASAGAGLQ